MVIKLEAPITGIKPSCMEEGIGQVSEGKSQVTSHDGMCNLLILELDYHRMPAAEGNQEAGLLWSSVLSEAFGMYTYAHARSPTHTHTEVPNKILITIYNYSKYKNTVI